MAGKEIELVVNPAAGGGRAGRMLGDVSRELARVGFSVTVHRTVGRAEMSELTRKLVAQGAPYVGVMGGDGTFHDAINSLLGDDGAVLDASRRGRSGFPTRPWR
jgi:diacylglycerol kinase family enzyme